MIAESAPAGFRAADVQGNILRGYHYSRIRHLVLEVVETGAARRWLGSTLSGSEESPQVTSEEQWPDRKKPEFCFNMGLTFEGLRAFGVSDMALATFPDEFVEGMVPRAPKLGDVGDSAPSHWAKPFANPEAVHLIASLHADDKAHLNRMQGQVEAASGGALRLHATLDGWNFDKDYVHFGYQDSISQPRFAGIHDREAYPDAQPLSPIGAMLMGYPTEYEGLLWNVPQPDVLGRNGAFNAFRILAQDVKAFEDWLDEGADQLQANPLTEQLLPAGQEAQFGEGVSRHAALREVVASRMCGRWRNGVPVALSPYTPNPVPMVSRTDFDYVNDHCPYGAHMRRCNPRGGMIVQRAARHTRRLVRRGVPYGPAYDHAHPDGEERGLLGNFLCANLGAQFEALSCDWLNLGLQDPRITGTNDPLLGANVKETSRLDIVLEKGATIQLRGFPRFVRTRGGAYTFLPGLPALRYLAGLGAEKGRSDPAHRP